MLLAKNASNVDADSMRLLDQMLSSVCSSDLKEVDDHSYTILNYAATGRDVDVLRRIVGAMEAIDVQEAIARTTGNTRNGESLLMQLLHMEASASVDLQRGLAAAEYLLDLGCDPFFTNGDGSSILHAALHCANDRHLPLVERILKLYSTDQLIDVLNARESGISIDPFMANGQ
jgi:hypothetical protein